MRRNADIKYDYKSLSVPGGGFVTGFLFHPTGKKILYCRTDIGGVYRFDHHQQSWHFLGSSITEFEHHLTQPLSLAVDEDAPDKLYVMCGNSRKGNDSGKAALLISSDRGDSFIEKSVPFCCNGNAPARSTAERLAYKNGSLFFGSQGEGLWRSRDEGDTWTRLSFSEENIVFVSFVQNNIMLVSCTGETCADGNNRGHTLFVSYDMGGSFERLHIPSALNDERCCHNGFVAGGIASSGNAVYITFSHSFKENRWGGWNDFSCDNGGGFDGRVYRYVIANDRLEFDKDITPSIQGHSDNNTRRRLPFALGGIDVSGSIVAVCSIGGHGDAIFISKDGGSSYVKITSTDIERFRIDVPYLKPEYNGGRIPLHWMSCLRFDPSDADFAVINTGTGVFALRDVTSDAPYITTLCNGIEETVHMNIYSVPEGKNLVIDLVGDLGGFAFRQLDRPCENSFADAHGHRYITCLNADKIGR
ncbi:MAG: exo-alpha-sialidase, partial [Ruminococcaceae bacterium]|nr:exo-alpha-sialidase [Oscillospiraceae bacterium]